MASVSERLNVTIEHAEDDRVYSTAGRGERFADVMARRLSRRGLVKAGAAASAIATVGVTGPRLRASGQAAPSSIGFEAIAGNTEDDLTVASGYLATPLVRWGDPLTADAPEWDIESQSAAAQAVQVGYNCDYVGFFPLPQGSQTSDRGLLVINHEYTNPELMFPGYVTVGPPAEGEDEPTLTANPTQEIVDIELEAHGLSVVEVARDGDGVWSIVRDSEYNRRVTGTTPMELTGAAAGADLLKTAEDSTGTRVTGTLNNCAGGKTPWGTVVSGEENFNQYFANLTAIPEDDPLFAVHERYGLPEEASERLWENYHDRFDLAKEPNEPFRFGWGVEFDPYDPTSTPKKRTALGRNKHEGHTSVVAPGGQVVVYSGDDQRFDYAYKFVTAGSYNPDDRAANLDLLDEGTLYVAVFNEDGTGQWLPLVQGEGELTEANGFATQADVLINTRGAADLLGATKMDRPEDFETNPVTGKVYLVLTNNSDRQDLDSVDAANPRVNNVHGHIIELTEDGNDHAATSFAWEIFVLAGDPGAGSTYYAGFTESDLVSPFSAPDNITFDNAGNLWISTDGNNLDINDGLYAVPTEGEERGYVRQFFSVVLGAECTGPEFTPDNSSLFIAVQHPGEGGIFEEPVSLWPDGEGTARPSVVVVQSESDPTASIGGVPATPLGTPAATPEA